jgi:carboxylate-amine ligase
VEIDTEISDDVKQCREFLVSRIRQLDSIANELGLLLAILGTHPIQHWKDREITNQDNFQKLHQKYQWLIKRMNVYGLHIHVGVKNGELALQLSQAFVQFLPHFLALSANSPYWQGIDTGMQSTRVNIIESFPYSGIPPHFDNWNDFEHYCKTLELVGAITSIKDAFWYIRPNLKFGTLEFRICDAVSSLNETMALAALAQSLVVYTSEHLEEFKLNKEQQWIAPENLWNAARYGLEAIIINPVNQKQKIRDSTSELIKTLSPTAKSLNCYEELNHINQMLIKGNGAQGQREAFQKTGSLQAVIETSIKNYKNNFILEPICKR